MIVQDYVEQYWKIGNYNEHYFCFVNYYYFWIARRGRFDDGIKYDWSTILKSCTYNIWKHKRRLFRILELCTLSQWPRSLINSSLWNEVDKLDGKETSFPRWERCDIRVIPHFFSAAVRSWIARQILKSSRSSCRAEVYTGWLIGKLNVAPWIGHLLVGVVNVGVNLIKFAINLAWRNARVIFSHFC